MKKKIILSVCLLCVLLFFFACSNERRGVPESVFLREFGSQIESYTSYKITHKVDTTAHIDAMQLKLTDKGPYGATTRTDTYMYQYDKASDLWTFLSSETGTATLTLNEHAYIKASPMKGTYEALQDKISCSYSITFQEIDIEAMTARIYYEIYFNNSKIPYMCEYKTVAIQSFGPVAKYFVIEYSGSPKIESGSLWFWFNIDSGLNTSNFGW